MITGRYSRIDIVRWLLLLTLGSIVTLIIRSSVGLADDHSPGEATVRLFLASVGLAAFGAFSTALDRPTAWFLLQAPLAPRQLWRQVIRRSITTGVTPLLPLLILTIWELHEDIAWIPITLLWACAGGVLGAILAIQFWAAGSQVRARLTLPIIPLIIVIVLAARILGAFANVPLIALLPDPTLILIVGYGIGAKRLGNWYTRTAQDVINSPAPTRSWLGPLPDLLEHLLLGRSVPILAVSFRDLKLQARDGFFAIRYLIAFSITPLWLLLSDPLGHATASLLLLLIAGGYGLIEITPSPVGMEGSRFIQTWLTSATPQEILLGKLINITMVNGMQIIVAAISLALVGADITRSVFIASTITIGSSVIVTALSTFDLDMHLPVSGPVQRLMLEHLPLRPWRLVAIATAIAAGSMVIMGYLHFNLWLALIGYCVLVMVVFYRGLQRLEGIMVRAQS